MLPIESRGEEVTMETVEKMDATEGAFAYACLESGCQLRWQIPIMGGSVIDFWVVNPRREDAGKLVEVTRQKQNRVENARTNVKRKSILRKRRQIANMKASGEKWTILYRREIENIIADSHK